MKTSKILWAGLLVVALTAISVPSFAALTAPSDAGASIAEVLCIENNLDLEFGALIPSTGGTAVVSTVDALEVTGAVTEITTSLVPHAAQFTVVGAGLATYDITLPTIPVVISNGVDTMNLTAFNATGGAGTISGAGNESFKVGATLTVGEAQPLGRYTGTFDVTVAYN